MSDSTALTPYTGPLPTGEELEKVRERIRDCRRRAVLTTWKSDPLSRATPLEIAVAEADRKPDTCVAHSRRSGLPCSRSRNLGTTVCPKHGGSMKHVKKAAQRRMAEGLNRAVARMQELSEQNDHLPTAQAATKAIIDKFLPALKREEGRRDKDANRGPVIQVGVVLGGAQQPVQITTGQKAKAALAAAQDGEVVDDE